MKVRTLSVLMVLIISLAFFYGSSRAENTLINPGFEESELEWYNWNDGASSGEITGEYSHSGNKSACREIAGVGTGCYGQVVPINPGDAIEVSVWIMNPLSEALSNGAEAYLRIEFWSDDGPLSFGHPESVHIDTPTDEWFKVDANTEAPANATEARILAFNKGNKNSSRGKVYFDDFEVSIK